MSDTSSRLLDLLSLLQARRDWPGAELAERLEVSGRTIRRDVERLRELGYPGRVADRAGRRLPAARRHRDAAAAARRGGGDRHRRRPAHGRARVGDRASRRPRSARSSSSSRCCRRTCAGASPRSARRRSRRRAGGPTVDPQHLTTIAAACRDSERLRFDYRSRDGTATRREVEPHSLVNLGRRWYLVAWDRAPRGLAHVPRRPARAGPPPTGVRFTPRALPAQDAAAYVEQSIAGACSRYEARVTVHAPADEIARAAAVGRGRARADRRASAASTAPPTTTSSGSRCASRCSTSRSRCTSRRSSSRTLRGLARRLERATGGEG